MDMKIETDALTGAGEETEVNWFSDDESEDDVMEDSGAEDAEGQDADDQFAENPDAAESAAQEAEAETAQADTAAEEPKYTVKYFGQEKEMPLSELIANAQKGMDYDRVRADFDTSKPVVELVKNLAKSMNLTVDEYVHVVGENLKNTQLESQVREQVEQGMPEDAARELAQLRQEKAARDAQQAAERQKAEKLEPWTKLLQEYPDIQPDKMPPEVMQRIAKGETPLEAMRAWEMAKLKTEQAAKDAAGKNKQTAPTSARSAGAKPEGDQFADGFDKGFG